MRKPRLRLSCVVLETQTGSRVASAPTTIARSTVPSRSRAATTSRARREQLQAPETVRVCGPMPRTEQMPLVTLPGVPVSQYSMPSASGPPRSYSVK